MLIGTPANRMAVSFSPFIEMIYLVISPLTQANISLLLQVFVTLGISVYIALLNIAQKVMTC